MFSQLSLISWLKFGAAVSVFIVCLVLGYKGVVLVTSHFDHIQQIEASNKALLADNDTLKGNNASLKSSLSAQQAELDSLTAELKKREEEKQKYEQKQVQLEQDLQKLREDSKSEIEAINKELRRVGISHIALPDSVVRMQRQRAKTLNARSRDRNQSAAVASPEGAVVSAVPGS